MYILLAHNDPDTHYTIQQAIKQVAAETRIVSVYNGLQLFGYLDREVQNGKGLPGLIISAVELPFINGAEVSEKLKENKNYSGIPNYLFSIPGAHGGISDQIDRRACQIFHTPVKFSDLKQIISDILSYHNLH
jgi:CheY-like chemotaxis protein